MFSSRQLVKLKYFCKYITITIVILLISLTDYCTSEIGIYQFLLLLSTIFSFAIFLKMIGARVVKRE